MTWARTLQDLRNTFRLWGVQAWAADHQRGTNTATVRYCPPGTTTAIDLAMSKQPTPEDNLRVLYLAVDAMRLNDLRGITDTVREAYLQLPAPTTARDPYETLGVRSDTPLEDIEAVYRSKAKRAHPDTGGSDAEMRALNEAMDAIRKEKQA